MVNRVATFEELAGQIVRGDTAACRQLVKRLERPLYLFLRQTSVPHADAQDVLQETFVAVWRGIAQLREPRSLERWVFQFCINAARRIRREPDAATGVESLELLKTPELFGGVDLLTERERDERLRRIVSGLSLPNREVIALHYFGGLSLDDCAAVLDLPHGTLKSRLSRGLAEVRARCVAESLLEENSPCPQP